MIKCKSCSTEISPKAASCPKCGHPNEQSKNLSAGQVLSALILVGGMLWWFASGGLEKRAADDLQRIKNQVAADAIKQYDIAQREGNAMQTCVQASLVSAAFLQAHDESNYRQWKEREKYVCESAGIHH